MHTINVADIEIAVERKPIKNMHLAVYPPDARVHISMPDYLTDDDARSFALQKLEWLRAQIEEIQAQPRQTERLFVSGESHYLFGRRYQLIVDESPLYVNSMGLKGNKIYMFVKPGIMTGTKAGMMLTWYRHQLKKELEPMISHWIEKLGEGPVEWQVKQMKTEWGSCISSKRLLIFNLELARVPRECIEFVIVHELCHLKIDNHNKLFEALMNHRLPNWRTLRKNLNGFVALPYKE
ncbi:MAG: SprT family zinc-dependent metalloprotease [Bacteroidales bacterium]|nr:SprT family zinc-dependent metalloprotease [Bacteroidales bacterium]